MAELCQNYAIIIPPPPKKKKEEVAACMIMMSCVKLGWIIWNGRGAEFLKLYKLQILQSALNDPKTNLRNFASKVLPICAL